MFLGFRGKLRRFTKNNEKKFLEVLVLKEDSTSG
jgi:hypothetical protein